MIISLLTASDWIISQDEVQEGGRRGLKYIEIHASFYMPQFAKRWVLGFTSYMKWFNWQCRSPLQVILTIHPYYHPLYSLLACPIKFDQLFNPWRFQLRHVSKGGIYKVCPFHFLLFHLSSALLHTQLFVYLWRDERRYLRPQSS